MRCRLIFGWAGWAIGLTILAGCPGPQGDPFLVEVIAFSPGAGAGFGEEANVLGPPQGGGELQGSLDVLSLGRGGSITARLGREAIDGPGADIIVFENPFRFGDGTFREPGQLEVSADGETWSAFPCAADQADFAGCAGLEPVYAADDAGSDGGVPALDPETSGGDAFDLADLELSAISYVRITDRGQGEPSPDFDTGGFDLDAVAVVEN